MRILVTNDDGIRSEGIAVLAGWASSLGEVTVVAPKVEQSGKSHGIEIHKPFEVGKAAFPGGLDAYFVDSTPADCVRFAFAGLERGYDLVLSGINRGFNVGVDIMYSGTCAAAFEASSFGARSVAFSTDPASFETARRSLDAVYGFMTENGFFDYSDIYNVNIPLNVRGTLVTRQAGRYFSDRFENNGDGTYSARGYSVYADTSDLSLDLDAVMNSYISVSPLTSSRTCGAAYGALSPLNGKIIKNL